MLSYSKRALIFVRIERNCPTSFLMRSFKENYMCVCVLDCSNMITDIELGNLKFGENIEFEKAFTIRIKMNIGKSKLTNDN